MDLRQLTPADAEAFWTLRLRGFRDEPDAFGTSYEEAAHKPISEVASQLGRADAPDDFVLGAFAPELAGIVGLRREPRAKRRHRAELWGLHVAREARGQGMARALVAELVGRARALDGLEQILLTVMAHNAAARALYEAFGFTVYGLAPQAMRLGDRTFDELLMRLALR